MTFYREYQTARDAAERDAKTYGRPMGIESTCEYGRRGFRVFMLPDVARRFGFELRCEVVEVAR